MTTINPATPKSLPTEKQLLAARLSFEKNQKMKDEENEKQRMTIRKKAVKAVQHNRCLNSIEDIIQFSMFQVEDSYPFVSRLLIFGEICAEIWRSDQFAPETQRQAMNLHNQARTEVIEAGLKFKLNLNI